ncbi:MAG: phosphotyrosine protein phosphatase [Lachnospiraceae bacterium]|nr:phosphotyrosine protein phosphatase [Lachnospiraceae bacterium]
MADYKRIIFAENDGATRAPMAVKLFKSISPQSNTDVICRGLVVPFPAPLNRKTEAVMISKDAPWEDFMSAQLTDEDVTDSTLILVMDERQRRQVLSRIEHANEENTFVLSKYVGDELEIVDPYGGSLQNYGICYEMMKSSIEKLITILKKEK